MYLISPDIWCLKWLVLINWRFKKKNAFRTKETSYHKTSYLRDYGFDFLNIMMALPQILTVVVRGNVVNVDLITLL